MSFQRRSELAIGTPTMGLGLGLGLGLD